ncbi:MAG: sirohydrochlorin cobaltochelatase [Desulfobulbus sp.]
MHQQQAIVLAAFGTTAETALEDIVGIRAAMEAAYPQVPVRLAFTSSQIRRTWHQRAGDPAYRAAHPGISGEIFRIQGVLAAIATLQEQGYGVQIIQPAQIVPAEEFHDLAAHVRALASIRTMQPRRRPFHTLALGRPLLGAYDSRHPYSDDILAVALALRDDAALARSHKAALVYMGHGNPAFPNGGLYLECAERMRQLYPETLTLIGAMEGFPSLETISADLRRNGARRVLLKPFLVVAGKHALEDMAGEHEDSWRSRLVRDGFEVIVAADSLSAQPEVVRLFVAHAADAAADAGVELRPC